MKQNTLYLICSCINGFVGCKTEKRKSPCKHGQPMEQTRGLFCMCDSGVAHCQSHYQCHFNLANEFDVRSVLHGQVSLAAVNQIYVIHEAIDGCKNLKVH